MPPIEDHYATLGVPPRSEASVIRAAYLDLMRRFHPDRNSSPEAAERAHAIIAAFAVLGNVEKRLHYDWARRRAADEAAAGAQRRWAFNVPKAPIAAALAAMVLVPLSYLAFSGSDRQPPPVQPPPKVAAKRQPPPEIQAVAAPAEALLPLAVPEPIAVAEPDPPESALATRPVPRVPDVVSPAAPPAAPPKLVAKREPRLTAKSVKPQPPSAPTKPHCRSVNPGAEAAICNNDNLAALDRSVVTFYNQSLKFGAPAKRGPLLDARIAFLLKREECKTDACLQSLHLAHLRELSAIVEKGQPATPP